MIFMCLADINRGFQGQFFRLLPLNVLREPLVNVADQAKLVPVPDEMGGRFCKIVTGKAGNFPFLEYAARLLDFTLRGVFVPLADRRVTMHHRMVFQVKAFIAEADGNCLSRDAIMAVETFRHSQYAGCLGFVSTIVSAETEDSAARQ